VAARTVVARGRVGRRVGEWQRRVGPGEGDSPQVRVPLGRASGPGVRPVGPSSRPRWVRVALCRPNKVPTRPQTAPTGPRARADSPTFLAHSPTFLAHSPTFFAHSPTFLVHSATFLAHSATFLADSATFLGH
jgi:hypothetical protein